MFSRWPSSATENSGNLQQLLIVLSLGDGVFLPWRNHVVLLWLILPPSLSVPICTMGI